MDLKNNSAKPKLNKELYKAMMKEDKDKVIQLCRDSSTADGALQMLTIHKDTVLHIAADFELLDLVLNLLKLVPENQFDKLTHQNDIGNTILHKAATSDKLVRAAAEMLRKAPQLLGMRNHRGETALFRASRYGKIEMFNFLDDQVHNNVESDAQVADLKALHVREDKTSILHMSILAEHFELALLIAEKYKYLVGEQDGDGMTGLQLLCCNPSAFKNGTKQMSFLKRLVYSCVSTEDTATTEEVERCSGVPLWEAIRMQKKRYDSAKKLAKFLIANDTSWEDTESAIEENKPKTHKFEKTQDREKRPSPDTSTPKDKEISNVKKAETPIILPDPTTPKDKEISNVKKPETPIILATKYGCTEIVEEILREYPQAVEHIDDGRHNILHVAIKYRQIQIFDLVVKLDFPMRKLIREITNEGDSVLHMVGVKAEDHGVEDLRSPALKLREELLLFERVKEISKTYLGHFCQQRNFEGKTAKKKFVDANARHCDDAKEWLKRTAENCSVVAVLISTVAFAAAYTVPGGPNQSTGYPILGNRPLFVLFIRADVVSLILALTSVILFLSILTSPFRLKDLKQALPLKLMWGITLLIFSITAMMWAFAVTIILLMGEKKQQMKITFDIMEYVPVTIFTFSYLYLYIPIMKNFRSSLKKTSAAFPRCNCVQPLRSWIVNLFEFHKSKATKSQNIPETTRCPI